MRVVSWNVGRVYSPSSNNRLCDADVPAVAAALASFRADVVLLQELVEVGQLERLLVGLPDYDGRMSLVCKYDRHAAVLARRALRPAFEDVVLEPTGRGFPTVTFDVGAMRAVASSIHLDAFSETGRRSQAEALTALGEARTEPIQVVGGDCNLDPRYASVLDVGTFALLSARYREPRPLNSDVGTLMALWRVDHVLARGLAVKTLSSEVVRGFRLPMGDHDPLICDVDTVSISLPSR